ncbi:hypothetical protein A9Z05_07265 [Burkholderia sp. A2]|nr:hypothetical protein A9Z05_07265 [Burkholderia sp. A2]
MRIVARHRTGDQGREGSSAHNRRCFAVPAHEIALVDRKRGDVALSRERIQDINAMVGNGLQIRRIRPPRAVLVVELGILGHPAEGSKRRLVQSETLAFLFEPLRKDGQLTTIYGYRWSIDHKLKELQG